MSNIDLLSYNRQGQLYTATNAAAASVVAVSTTETGLILYNPVGSNKILAIVYAGFAFTTAPAAVVNLGIAVMGPNPTTLTGLTAVNVLSGSGSGNAGNAVGRAYNAATLPVAPVMQRINFGAAFGSAVGESPSTYIDYVDGAIMVQPGGVACLAAVTTTAVGLGSFAWIEVPFS